MKRALPVIALLVGLWTIDGAAQGRNFAGAWVVDAERTAAENSAAPTPAGAVVARRTDDGAAVVSAGGGGARSGGGGGGAAPTGAVAVARGAGGGGGGTFAAAGGAARAGGGGGRGGMAPGPQTISLDATTFTIATAETSTAYKLDGSATTTETPRGNITVKAGWKDDRIVIETTAPGAAGPMVSTTSWYLDGAALVRETSVTGADGQPIVRKTYYKRS